MQPLTGNSLHAQILQLQTTSSPELKAILWQQVIRAKINAQAVVLNKSNIDAGMLIKLAGKVLLGDSTNVEAQAARSYWPLLFGMNFRRRPDASEGVNSLLNYGYALIRSAVARALSSAGLHPALGIHHHHRQNAFALADDLIEPLRPSVDLVVVELQKNSIESLTPDAKMTLLSVLTSQIEVNGQKIAFLDALTNYVVSYRKCIEQHQSRLVIPVISV